MGTEMTPGGAKCFKPPGAACTVLPGVPDSLECSGGLCNDGGCNLGVAASGTFGSRCRSTMDCGNGVCIAGECVRVAAEGAPCKGNGDCLSDVCAAGTCVLLATGAPCNDNVNCAPPSPCLSRQNPNLGCPPMDSDGGCTCR